MLGWTCPEIAPAGPDHPARLRLTLDREGRVEWTVAPLPPAKAEWRVGLAAERLRSDDPWLRVKSTRSARPTTGRGPLCPAELDEVIC
jgi:4-amino-4-deoxychorismate lyase